MLSEETLELLSERLTSRIEKANTSILKSIGKSIKEIGTLNYTEAKQLEQMLIYGGDFNKIEYMLSQITDLNVKEIDEIFKEVAKKDLQFAKQFYKYRNKPFIPYEQNYEFKQEVEALKNITQEQYKNLMNTQMIGFTFKKGDEFVFKPLKEAYIEVLDQAILNISMGEETFDTAFKNTLKQLGKGLVTYDGGTTRRLDSVVRMNIKGALTDLHNQTQLMLGKQFDADGVEINVHENPAPDHALVQGRRFSIVRPSEDELSEYEKLQSHKDCVSYDGIEFPAISEETKHVRRSIGEYNCYHYIFSVILGTKPEYSNEELQEIIDKNEKGFELDGKHYSMYEGTQLQRKLETEIRKEKDTQILARESGKEELMLESQSKINGLTYKYKELCNKSGLKPKAKRMSVSGFKRVSIKKPR